jgi:hypothetical protein
MLRGVLNSVDVYAVLSIFATFVHYPLAQGPGCTHAHVIMLSDGRPGDHIRHWKMGLESLKA